MQDFLDSYPKMIAYLGVIDAAFILVLGLVSATLWLFDIKAEKVSERVMSACFILLGTSVAAGVTIAITRYISGRIV